jgi:hypothetical protein
VSRPSSRLPTTFPSDRGYALGPLVWSLRQAGSPSYPLRGTFGFDVSGLVSRHANLGRNPTEGISLILAHYLPADSRAKRFSQNETSVEESCWDKLSLWRSCDIFPIYRLWKYSFGARKRNARQSMLFQLELLSSIS